MEVWWMKGGRENISLHMAYGIAIAIGRHGENRERCDKERKKRQLRQDSRMNKKCSQVIVSRLRLILGG